MTRGKIVLIAQEKVLTSVEFNGDMYWPNDGWGGYGEEVVNGLIDIHTEQGYIAFVEKFNREHHDYKDVESIVYDYDGIDEEDLFNMMNGYFDKWFSDYLYIKNIRSETVRFIDTTGTPIDVESGGVLMLYYGEYNDECASHSIVCVAHVDQRFIAICEDLGWNVSVDDEYVELEKYSPAGEDFCFDVSIQQFVADVREYAESFSPDEHAYEWYGQHRGEPGSLRDLLDDAEAIADMLDELADALEGRK